MTESKSIQILSQNETQLALATGKNLKNALDGLRDVDKKVAVTLGSYTNPLRPRFLNNIVPSGIKRRMIEKLAEQDPLGSLERLLRKSINDTLVETGKINDKIASEVERIRTLQGYAQKAIDEGWTPAEYLEFIEKETDMNLKVRFGDKERDLKEVISYTYEASAPEKQEQKRQEWYDWLNREINRSRDYLCTMIAISQIAIDKVEPQMMSYYTVTTNRAKQQITRNLLETLQDGAVTSSVSEEATDAYGAELAKAAVLIYDAYDNVKKLRAGNEGGFRKEAETLQEKLNGMLLEAPKEERSRYVLPGKTEK